MGSQDSFHSSRRMGAWIIDMADVEAAHTAIACCRAETSATIEVRHTLWGVQVQTESQAAADCLAVRYGATPAALPLAA